MTLLWPQLAAAAAPAEPTFPRDGGFYFSIPKLVLLIFVYFCWLAAAKWVHQDAGELSLPQDFWNSLMFGAAVTGLAFLWLLPWFWASFPILLAVIATPWLFYIRARNQLVPASKRVLTKQHLREFFMGLTKPRARKEQADEEEEDEVSHEVPVEFIGKSSKSSGDGDMQVARAAGSKGYKGARVMVYEAIERRATDIHLEPTRDEMSVRFRIDGILQTTDPFSRHMGDAVVNIFKVLCDLDITEKRKPQDGSFSANVDGRTVDFRVATAGSVSGEKLVMRILDKSKHLITLTELGMRERMRDQIHDLVTQPHGLFIVCGPTGSGKSTTLYACLNEIDRYQKNIITVEDPVEYQLDAVTQIEVNAKVGKTFASELRSILRQDPNVIMIGEIRDAETAEIACQAAQTGHMVFTTLHANDAVTALGRLFDLGVKPFTVATALSAVLSQRLVRVLCEDCRVRYKPNPELLRKANLPADKIKYFYRPPTPEERTPPPSEEDENQEPQPVICEHCGGTGYYGRTGIFEVLIINDRIRELIRENPNLNAIRQEAVKNGMRYLQEDGLRQVIEGQTAIEELLRVCK